MVYSESPNLYGHFDILILILALDFFQHREPEVYSSQRRASYLLTFSRLKNSGSHSLRFCFFFSVCIIQVFFLLSFSRSGFNFSRYSSSKAPIFKVQLTFSEVLITFSKFWLIFSEVRFTFSKVCLACFKVGSCSELLITWACFLPVSTKWWWP